MGVKRGRLQERKWRRWGTEERGEREGWKGDINRQANKEGKRRK